jgi:Flp pilus assembly protein TadG
MSRFARRDERGDTLVEAAFVVPLLFLFILGVLDLGLWEFQNSQASSAARDGARVGILQYLNADTAGQANNTAVVSAVNARLGGRAPSVTVTCIGPSSTTAKACDNAINVDSDRIKVDVSWARPPLSFVSKLGGTNSQTVHASATMQIGGLPQ